MSDANDDILHQDDVEGVIEEVIEAHSSTNTAIADLVAITGGQSPTEGEHNLVLEAVNDILAALRTSDIIPEA